jgi:hypothetical protein
VTDRMQDRDILPVPNMEYRGLVEVAAKDPNTSLSPIEQIGALEGAAGSSCDPDRRRRIRSYKRVRWGGQYTRCREASAAGSMPALPCSSTVDSNDVH